jgi:DNA-binding beta-propeller fold protein YncE
MRCHTFRNVTIGISLLVSPTAYAAPVFLGSFGTYSQEPGGLWAPVGIAVDDSGQIYVADASRRLTKFSASGSFLGMWGPLQPSDPDAADGVAINRSSGEVFTINTYMRYVQKFSRGLRLLQTWGSPVSASAIAAAPSGTVYVFDHGYESVRCYGSSGGEFLQWGGFGSQPGQFAACDGMAVDKLNYVYIADRDNHRIQKLTHTGQCVLVWGAKGTGPGQFNGPESVAVSDDGIIYVIDGGNSRVQAFLADGTFVDAWGSQGTQAPFNHPRAVAVAPDGTVLVLEQNPPRVSRFGYLPTASTHSSWGRVKRLYR